MGAHVTKKVRQVTTKFRRSIGIDDDVASLRNIMALLTKKLEATDAVRGKQNQTALPRMILSRKVDMGK